MILLHISQKDGGGAAGGGSTHNLRFTRQRVNEMSYDVITSVSEIGEVRVSVAIVCLSVCLSVCPDDNSRTVIASNIGFSEVEGRVLAILVQIQLLLHYCYNNDFLKFNRFA